MERLARGVLRDQAARMGVDVAKRVIQVHAIDGASHDDTPKKLNRSDR